MTEVEEQEEYEVRIGAFNGPMDLLVYLVQKKEVPLEQISIAEIADQFLKWVNEYEGTDLSKAGDFLYMASRLMALKVQELLPAEQRDPEMEAEYNEDREQLMKEMLEYQRFKQVASGLQEMESENFGTYSRGRLEKTQTDEETLADANIWQLFRAYQKSLKTKISETIHHIELDYVTIQDRQQAINNYLAVNGRALFEDLLDNDSHPIVAAVTFMAMLEMIKTDEIVFRQSELFGPIWIYRKKNNADYAEEMAHETVFFSKDPDVKPGLVEAIRNQAIARSKEQTVGDLAAVMREAVLWTERGRNVSEEDLTAMLEGREDLSEVQENPFAEMMKEDEATENAQAPTEDAPAEGTQAPAENAPAEPVADTAATTTETVAEETSAPVEETVAPVVEETPVEENEEWIASLSTTPRDDVSEEPVDASIEPAEEISSEEPQPADNMTDEEFEAFMKKAQAFYDTQANENSDSDDDDDFSSIEVHSND
ncbi:MAG: segregation/condensation protein A [Fibrobacter sp.]|nr:segregation/condensation protein A [Fibrobacter sp.]